MIRPGEMQMIGKYLVLLKKNWQTILEYRAGMVIWILANSLPLVMMAVWMALAESGPVGGFDARDFVSYYLALLLVRQLTTVWIAWELDHDIRMGGLSAKLLRPINPFHDYLSLHLADKFFRLFTVVPMILTAMILVPGLSYNLSPLNGILFVLSLSAAFAIRFISQYCIGLLSFWITQSLSLNEMFYAGMLMFGGVIAPLELFPPGIARAAEFLPFRYMLSLPVEILLGRLGAAQLAGALLVQFLWLLCWSGLASLLWRAGLKQYSAVGS